MNANKQAKHAQVKEISEKITSSKAMVVAEYAGLSVKQLQDLRKDLKAHGVELKVYKNRLFRIAANDAGINLDENLVGQNIYAFGMEDEISPAKVLAKFAKEHEALKLKAGTYEGKVIDSAELAVIATLPSYDEALTMLAMSMLSPIKYVGSGLHMLVEEGKLEAAPAAPAQEAAPAEEAPEAPVAEETPAAEEATETEEAAPTENTEEQA